MPSQKSTQIEKAESDLGIMHDAFTNQLTEFGKAIGDYPALSERFNALIDLQYEIDHALKQINKLNSAQGQSEHENTIKMLSFQLLAKNKELEQALQENQRMKNQLPSFELTDQIKSKDSFARINLESPCSWSWINNILLRSKKSLF